MWPNLARFFRWLFRREPKCYICKERRSLSELNSVSRHGIYGGVLDSHHFHTGCLYAVLEDPEFYGHGEVDRALWISDKIVEESKEKEESQERRMRRVRRAKDAEFWGEISP